MRYCNYIAEFGEPLEEAICRFFGFDLVQTGVSEFLVRLLVLPHVEGADEDRVSYGDDSAFGARRAEMRRNKPER